MHTRSHAHHCVLLLHLLHQSMFTLARTGVPCDLLPSLHTHVHKTHMHAHKHIITCTATHSHFTHSHAHTKTYKSNTQITYVNNRRQNVADFLLCERPFNDAHHIKQRAHWAEIHKNLCESVVSLVFNKARKKKWFWEKKKEKEKFKHHFIEVQ